MKALDRAASNLPRHEDRPEQRAMAAAVGRAIRQKRHLVVRAGTGTGKSLAYLVPALALGTRVIVSTATKALQDQLAYRDLPQLAVSLRVPFQFAVLKGRSNYICLQRVKELLGDEEQLVLDEGDVWVATGANAKVRREVERLVSWALRSGGRRQQKASAGKATGDQVTADRVTGERVTGDLVTGDRAELSWEPSEAAWAQVSTGWRECPGASSCPSGGDCFAEGARRRAAKADVVVVNTHLYTTSLAIEEGELLPPHDLVVFDEAHELEDIASAALGFDLNQARLIGLARLARPLVPDRSVASAVEDGASVLSAVLRPHLGQALQRPLDEDVALSLGLVRERANRLVEELRKRARSSSGESGATGAAIRGRKGNSRGARGAGGVSGGSGASGARVGSGAWVGSGAEQVGSGGSDEVPGARSLRAQQAASNLLGDLNEILELPEGQIAWVEGPEHSPVLRVAPIDVGEALKSRLWQVEGAPTAVLASATIPHHLGASIGLTNGTYDEIDVGSPFSYAEQALLYCPVHLPDPRAANFEAVMHEELVALIEAAQGRTLALFTSWRAMHAAADVVRQRASWTVLTQADLPKPRLVAQFSSDEHSCLFATMGFWQGVDVPGPSLSVVTIDRLPFPRPDDPLLQARRAALGPAAFESIDLPRAGILLAQGVGRLIRSRQDRGVVAVFDRRLGKASYRWELVNSLPPMRRTRSRAEVEGFLVSLRAAEGS
jgi:ATP-dependent DNA helicase DinG